MKSTAGRIYSVKSLAHQLLKSILTNLEGKLAKMFGKESMVY